MIITFNFYHLYFLSYLLISFRLTTCRCLVRINFHQEVRNLRDIQYRIKDIRMIRVSRADVPVRIRSSVVDIQVERTTLSTVTTVTTVIGNASCRKSLY